MADSYVYQEFPKWVYHKHSVPYPESRPLRQIVNSAVEQGALGAGWIDNLQVLQLVDAPAVASDDAIPASGTDWIVESDLLGFLRSHLTDIRTWLNESARFSAFFDFTGPVLIGGPENDIERRRQQQRLVELIEQPTRALNLVPAKGNALVAGLDALRVFALDCRFDCAHTLNLPGHPVRVDRIGEVLEVWLRHLITLALTPRTQSTETAKTDDQLRTIREETLPDEFLVLCDRLGPVEAGPQRRAAVTDKLTCVSQETGDVWRYDTDFWKAAKQYQHRKTFSAWLRRGEVASPSAHKAFCRVLLLSSAEFVAARNQWKKKPKRVSRKKPAAR